MPWSQEVDSNPSDVRRAAWIGSGADTLCIMHVDLISLMESHMAYRLISSLRGDT